ncbi:protein kinase [Actinoplanes sp. NPDC051346]|uniref:protein kinase domain-containing protein n=1 Tax=Actinoplanes sp. NPDC051346 TaxID=3155048 RepID=UPI00343B98D7
MRGPLRPNDPRRLGGYRLESRLGQGGMGTVYLGYGRDRRPVAIKVIKPEYAYEEQFRARFRSEVNRARQVPPFCTAEVLDADADHETPYLVVEYVDGPSLAEIVAEQGPLTSGNLYSVAVGVATALAAIHGAGVIHRDLKPRNVLFSLGTPKVIDFGIARAFEATSQHTGTDQMVGTVAYMAPERFEADASRTVGPAADVFAWGVVVAYAGTGRTPFGGDSAAATAASILTQPPDLTGLPAPLRDIVASTLEKDPGSRPSASDLLDMLLAAGAQDPSGEAGLAGPPELRRVVREVRRSGPGAGRRRRGGHPETHGTGVTSRRWRRAAPALAAAAIVGIAAAGLLMFPPARQLVLGQDSDAASRGAVAAPADLPAPSGGAGSNVSPSSEGKPGRGRASDPAAPAGEAGRDRDAPTATATPAVSPPVRLCRNSDIALSISAQGDNPGAPGTQKAIVAVANKSATACRVDGRAFITLYNAANEPVAVPTEVVDEPGPVVAMVIRPERTAFQGMKWQACDRGDTDCPVGNTLVGSLSRSSEGVAATLEGFPSPLQSNITMRTLQLGTLQGSTTGVVSW